MAKMIPSQYNLDTTSYGEQQMFHALEGLPSTYTVFHSFALNNHAHKLMAEIDYVILSPMGVLCLEVKGGRIASHNRQWYSYGGGNESRPIENPFTQAQTATMALYSQIRGYFKSNRNITDVPFVSGVALPDIPFNQQGPEVRAEIVYDKDTPSIESYIQNVFAYWAQEFSQRNHQKIGLSKNAHAQLEKYLLQDFDIVYTMGTKIDQMDQHTIRLTQEQTQMLDAVARNPRILITGGAGTGKTILSLEHAQRMASKGEKVIFLCYNHNLAFHLQHQVMQNPDVKDNLQVHAFYKYLVQVLDEQKYLPQQPPESDKEAYSRYWKEDLPQAFLELAEAQLHQQWDTLIVDEGQDLLAPSTLLCLDQMVAGGLHSGRWLIGMDHRQNIYQTDLDAGVEYLKEAHPTNLTLEKNYRNTKEIIDYTISTTGIDPEVTPLIQGLEIRKDHYDTMEEQRIKLVKILEQLKKENILPADICIVSLTSFEKSVLQGKERVGKFDVQRLADLHPRDWDKDKIKFSSVHRFKGLESPVVILTDVTSTSGQYSTRCYTAMTRAKALLWVIKKYDAAN